jgi:hypothetical protein
MPKTGSGRLCSPARSVPLPARPAVGPPKVEAFGGLTFFVLVSKMLHFGRTQIDSDSADLSTLSPSICGHRRPAGKNAGAARA